MYYQTSRFPAQMWAALENRGRITRGMREGVGLYLDLNKGHLARNLFLLRASTLQKCLVVNRHIGTLSRTEEACVTSQSRSGGLEGFLYSSFTPENTAIFGDFGEEKGGGRGEARLFSTSLLSETSLTFSSSFSLDRP